MGGNLQAMIDQANKRAEAGRKKQFIKKATDAQLLDSLLLAAEAVLRSTRAVNDSTEMTTLADQVRLVKRARAK
jgi:hypothetical protein